MNGGAVCVSSRTFSVTHSSISVKAQVTRLVCPAQPIFWHLGRALLTVLARTRGQATLEGVDQGLKFIGQRGDRLNPFPTEGMLEPQLPGVEGLPLQIDAERSP